MADLDLQVKGGGGGGGGEEGGHPDPEMRGGPGLKNFFSASVWSKNKGGKGDGPLGPSPRSPADDHYRICLSVAPSSNPWSWLTVNHTEN